jgi:putative two-component system hydrogenase maturation factor HypX/HoxX
MTEAALQSNLPLVLLVDDELRSLEAMRRALDEDCRVLTASDADTALALLARHPVDVVLCDQRMPHTTGVALLTQVRERWPDVVRIVISAYSDSRDIIAGINEAGIFRYLLKPWSPDELLLAVQAGLHARRESTEPSVAPTRLSPSRPQTAWRILLLTQAFNGLSQRLWLALRDAGHTVSVELDISDAVTEEAVRTFKPNLLVAPLLKRRLPPSVWQALPCLVVHPGPPGDRGPNALDHALLQGLAQWGVTVLQADAEYDAGRVWAWRALAVPQGQTKASWYRREVTDAAVAAVMDAVAALRPGHTPRAAPPWPGPARGWAGPPEPELRELPWDQIDTATALRRIRSADSAPGARALLFNQPCRVYDAHPLNDADWRDCQRLTTEPAQPGQVLACRGPAVLVRTLDRALWIGHVRRPAPPGSAAGEASGQALPGLKLPATLAFAQEAAGLPEMPVPLMRDDGSWDELLYSEFGGGRGRVGWLQFDFHNGAMSERQARRLVDALRFARSRDTRVLVLAGGQDFFCNGIHLHAIEAASHRPDDSAADASWRNIQAIDDVVLELLNCTDRITVAALSGSAGAGGCFLAMAADEVWAHDGVVLNPHYKNMGNLHGSEYWTYVLPRRVGQIEAQALMQNRFPIGMAQALQLGLVDQRLASDAEDFSLASRQAALDLATCDHWAKRVQAKARQREADEAQHPLAAYREAELQRMHRNFYGFDPSYHVARHHFVHRKPHAWTPRHLAIHR